MTASARNYRLLPVLLLVVATSCASGAVNNQTSDASTTSDGSWEITNDTVAPSINDAGDCLNCSYDTGIASPGPQFISLAGANAAADGYINNAEKNSNLAAYSLNANNYVGASYTDFFDQSTSPNCDSSQSYTSNTIPLINTMPTAEGSYVICVKLISSEGAIAYGKSSIIIKDTTIPSVSLNNPPATVTSANQAAFPVSGTCSENGRTVTIVEFASDMTCNAGTYSANLNLTSANQGTLNLTARTCDAAGNCAQSSTKTITKDTLSSVTISGANGNLINASNVSSYTLSGTCKNGTVAISGAASTNVNCISGAWSAVFNLSSAAEGSLNFTATATDINGNVATASLTVTKDTVAPTFNSLPLANQAADGILNIADIALNNAIAGAISGSGYVEAYEKAVANSANCGTQTYSSTNAPLAGSLSGLNGTYKVCVKLVDTAGNATYGQSSSITIDTTAPTVNVGANQTQSSQFTITPTVAGASGYRWSVTSGSSSSITFGSPTSAITTVSANANGTYTLRLTVNDAAGNTAYDEMILTWNIRHTIFITSTQQMGNLGGLTGGDAICQARANAAGLTGTYKAILSSSNTSAKSRLTISGPIYRTDNTLVASNSTDLWDGTLTAAIDCTEFAQCQPTDNYAFTGSFSGASGICVGFRG